MTVSKISEIKALSNEKDDSNRFVRGFIEKRGLIFGGSASYYGSLDVFPAGEASPGKNVRILCKKPQEDRRQI